MEEKLIQEIQNRIEKIKNETEIATKNLSTTKKKLEEELETYSDSLQYLDGKFIEPKEKNDLRVDINKIEIELQKIKDNSNQNIEELEEDKKLFKNYKKEN